MDRKPIDLWRCGYSANTARFCDRAIDKEAARALNRFATDPEGAARMWAARPPARRPGALSTAVQPALAVTRVEARGQLAVPPVPRPPARPALVRQARLLERAKSAPIGAQRAKCGAGREVPANRWLLSARRTGAVGLRGWCLPAPLRSSGRDPGDPSESRALLWRGTARDDGAQRDAFDGGLQQKVLLINHFWGHHRGTERHRLPDDGALGDSALLLIRNDDTAVWSAAEHEKEAAVQTQKRLPAPDGR